MTAPCPSLSKSETRHQQSWKTLSGSCGKILLWIAGLAFAPGVSAQEVHFPSGTVAYVVVTPKSELQERIVQRLANYLHQVLGQPARCVRSLDAVPGQMPAIILQNENSKAWAEVSAPSASPEGFALHTLNLAGHPVVVAVGQTELGLKRAVQRLILKSEQREPGLVIPNLKLSESPWIPRREFTLVNWIPQFQRGVFHNPHADLRLNIWLYGDEQLARYVDMFDAFGFSGGQFSDSTYGYTVNGSREAFRSRQWKIAKALRANGQNVTYRVWAAQFTGYGWVDPDVTYTPAEGRTMFDDPKVRAGFEKYYNHYAELAPYVDLLIAQFYDPGQLKHRADVFNYMHLLIGKFRAKQPKLELGVTFWSAGGWKEGSEAQFMQELIDNGFSDALLLQNTMPHAYGPGVRESLHQEARRRNLKMGVWGWNTAEKETDQIPNMHVNTQMMANVYRQIRDGAHQIHPITYWSEMEGYHLNNIFSQYSASQLLWNPDRDPDEILREITEGIWGPRHGPQMLEAVQVIQDVRTGPTWGPYWERSPTARLNATVAQDDLRRAHAAIAGLEKMPTDSDFVPKFPLPFPPATFVELTLPHLRQIKQFAEFRLEFIQMQEAAKKGAVKEELTRLVQAAWKPIPEYNTWIGVFGQAEARMQEKLIIDFAQEHGLEVKAPGWVRWQDANRQLQSLQTWQRRQSTPFRINTGKPWPEVHWTLAKSRDRFQLLIDSGCVEKVEGEMYQLTHWEEYRLR